MGFFGNFFESVKSAGSFVLSHAGDIASAVKTVATIAGAVALPTETFIVGDEASDNLTQFYPRFSQISTELDQTAVNATKKKAPAWDDNENPLTLKDSITGIFKDPTALTNAGLPTQTMYEDLSKFLGQMNVPTVYQQKSDPKGDQKGDQKSDPLDVVNKLGSALFVLKPPPTDPTDLTGFPDTLPVSLDVPGGTIHAAHTYYYLPMGKAGNQNSLHSALAVRYHTTKAKHKQLLLERSNLIFTSPTIDQPGWLITLHILWGKTVQANTVQNEFQTAFAKDYKDFKIQTSQLTGTLQLLKVLGPGSTTPAIIRSAVQTAANAVLTQTSSSGATPAAGELVEQNVPVEVLDSAFMLGPTSSQDAKAVTSK